MKSPSSSPRVRRLKLVWALLLTVLLSTTGVLSPQTAQAQLVSGSDLSGSSAVNASPNCSTILAVNSSAPSGLYWLDADGDGPYAPAFDEATDLVEAACEVFIPQ